MLAEEVPGHLQSNAEVPLSKARPAAKCSKRALQRISWCSLPSAVATVHSWDRLQQPQPDPRDPTGEAAVKKKKKKRLESKIHVRKLRRRCWFNNMGFGIRTHAQAQTRTHKPSFQLQKWQAWKDWNYITDGNISADGCFCRKQKNDVWGAECLIKTYFLCNLLESQVGSQLWEHFSSKPTQHFY